MKHTKGVVTGTVVLLYLVCTTGAFKPEIACGSEWKSELINLCVGKHFSKTSKNCISLVGINSGFDKLAAKGVFVLRYRKAALVG